MESTHNVWIITDLLAKIDSRGLLILEWSWEEKSIVWSLLSKASIAIGSTWEVFPVGGRRAWELSDFLKKFIVRNIHIHIQIHKSKTGQLNEDRPTDQQPNLQTDRETDWPTDTATSGKLQTDRHRLAGKKT